MAAQDRVVIVVDVDLGGSLAQFAALKQAMDDLDKRTQRYARHLNTTRQQTQKASDNYDKIEKAIKKTNDRLDQTVTKFNNVAGSTANVNKALNNHGNAVNRVNRRHSRFGRTLSGLIKPITGFVKALSKIALFGLIGQLGLFTLGLLSVKLAMITGRAAVSVYDVALKGLSVTAAGVATSLAVAAAAMRQFNEAMLIPAMGGAMNRQGAQKAATLNRSLGSRNMGLLGGEASKAVIASFAKAGVSPTQSANMARQMINLAGGDPAAAQQIAVAISSGDLNAAKAAVSGSRGFEKGSLEGVSSISQLMSALGSGSVVSENFRGVSGGLAGTFVGTAKTEFAGLINLFADMGQLLLGPFRNAMMDISRIIRQNFIGMTALINRFGADSFAPTLVTLVDKTMDFIRGNIFEHLDNIEQMGEGFVGFFRAIRDFFVGVGDYLREFEPAADVLIDMFGAMRATGGGRGLFRAFADAIVVNADSFKEFGASVGRVIGAIFDLAKAGQGGFFSRLDLFSEIMDRVASELVPAIGEMLNRLVPILEQLPNAVSGLATVIETVVAPVLGTLANVLGMIMSLGSAGGAFGSMAMIAGLLVAKNPMKTLQLTKMAQDAKAQRAAGAAGGSSKMMAGAGGLMAGLGALETVTSGPSLGASAMTIGGASMVSSSLGKGMGPGLLVGAAADFLARGFAENNRRHQRNVAFAAGAANLSEISLKGKGAEAGQAEYDELMEIKARYNNMLGGSDVFRIGGNSGFEKGDEMIRRFLGNIHGAFRKPTRPEQFLYNMFGQDVTVDGLQINRESQDFQKFAKDATALGFNLDLYTDSELAVAVQDGGEIFDAFQAVMDRANEEMEAFNENTLNLSKATGLSNEKIHELADVLKFDLFETLENGIDSSAAAAVFLGQTLTPIDRNQTYLPDLKTSSLGLAELSTSANSAFNTLISTDAADLSTDLFTDLYQAMAVLEVAQGMSPDIAALSGNIQLQRLLDNGTFTGERAQTTRNIQRTATTGILEQIAEDYELPLDTLLTFGGPNETITNVQQVGAVERYLDRAQTTRRALNLGSNMTGSERYMAIQREGGLLGNLDTLRANIINQGGFNATPERFTQSIPELLREAEERGVDTSEILISTLAQQELLRDNDAMSATRNTLLSAIKGEIEGTNSVLADMALRDYNRERYADHDVLA